MLRSLFFNQSNVNSQQGFTLVELVMVMVLLGILAAVALPRFMNITEEAHQAALTGTMGAMNSAVYIAHAKWLASGQPISEAPTAGIDFLNSGYANVGFNSSGWPDAANKGDKDLELSDVLGQGSNNSQICAQIMKNILSSSSMTLGVAENCGQQYCAIYKDKKCYYLYEKNKSNQRYIIYNPQTGEVTKVLQN